MHANAQSAFTNVYSTDKYVQPTQLIRLNSNSFFIIGATQSSRYAWAEDDFHITRCNPDGTVSWIRNFDIQSDDHVASGIITSDNNLLVTGYYGHYSFPNEWAHSFAMKTDLNGTVLWSRKLLSPFTIDKGRSVVETDDGGFLITGYYNDDSLSTKFLYLCKLSSAGNLLWSKGYEGYYKTEGYQLIRLGNDNYLMVGSSNTSIFLAKIDGNGNAIWAKTYGITALPKDVIQTSDGGFLVLAYNPVTLNNDNLWYFKVDPTGNVQFAFNFGLLFGTSVFEASPGRYFLSGNYYNSSSDKTFLCETNSNGSMQWVKTLAYNGRFYLTDAVPIGSTMIDLVGYTDELGYGSHDNTYVVRTDLSNALLECLEDTGIVTQTIRTLSTSTLQLSVLPYTIVDSSFTIYTYNMTAREEQPCDTVTFQKKISPTLNRPYYGSDFFTDITETDEGDYLAVGQSYYYDGLKGLFLVKTNNNGNVIWSKLFKSTYGEFIQAVGNDEYIIGGSAIGGDPGFYPDVIKINSEGDVIWNIRLKRLNASQSQLGDLVKPTSMSLTKDRRFIYLLVRNGSLFKLDLNGNIIWHKAFQDIYAKDAKPTQDGGFVIVGNYYDLGNPPAHAITYVVKGDSSGSIEWARSYTLRFDGGISGYSIAETYNGDFLVAGTGHFVDYDMTVLRIDSLGIPIWRNGYEDNVSSIGTSFNSGIAFRITKQNDSTFIIWNKDNINSDPGSPRGYFIIRDEGQFINLNTFRDDNFFYNSINMLQIPSLEIARSNEDILFCGNRNRNSYLVRAKYNGYFYCNSSGLGFTPAESLRTESDTLIVTEIATTLDVEYPMLSGANISYDDEYICGYCESKGPQADFNYSVIGGIAIFVDRSTGADSTKWIIYEVNNEVEFTGDSVIYQFPYTYDYTVCIHVSNKCGSATECRKIHLTPNAVKEMTKELQISVKPNIFRESIFITTSVKKNINLVAEILDISGKVCYSFKLMSETEMNLSQLSSGLYFLKINGENTFQNFKLIKY